MARINVAVFSSRRETGLQNIVDAVKQGELDVNLAVLLCNVPGAPVIERAQATGVPAVVLDHRPFKKNREAWEREAVKVLREHGVDLVVFAGFLRLVTPSFIKEFQGRIINTHPSLLPAFPGMYAQRQALDARVRVSGYTIHFVDESVDLGPIILQRAVPVLEDDTEETLTLRILKQERIFLPLAIKLFAEGRLTIGGRGVRIRTDGIQLPPMA